MRTVDEIRDRLKTANQSAVGRAVGLDPYKVNNIAHGRRDLSYQEGVAMLPILFPEDTAPQVSESCDVATERAHELATGLLQSILRRAVPDEATRNVIQEVFASSLRAALSLPASQHPAQPDGIADLFWHARPPQ